MTRIAIDGAELAYRTDGDGEPLVLVHGSASDYRTWNAQIPDFASSFRVIAYSRRYHWPNEPIPDDTEYTMQQHVSDLRALLRATDAVPAHLVGHSYGGFLCLLLAIAEPALVRSLVLVEPPVITLFVSSTPRPAEILKLLFTRPRTAAAIVHFGATGIAPATRAMEQGNVSEGIRLFGDAVFGRGGFERLPEEKKQQVLQNSTNIRAEILGPGFLPVGDDEVRAVRQPVLLMEGGRSVRLFRRITGRLEELLPHAARRKITGGTHAMHEDDPAAFNAAVRQFLTAHRQY